MATGPAQIIQEMEDNHSWNMLPQWRLFSLVWESATLLLWCARPIYRYDLGCRKEGNISNTSIHAAMHAELGIEVNNTDLEF
ncbi:hypothetical protein TNCV_291301 [Trichonephila clavipes]|nr:hypothetical protein TNCV_291301 [Trichonephila clavipes]